MKQNFNIIFVILMLSIIFGCSIKNDSSKRLVLKDGLFYKDGNDNPYTGVDTVRGLKRIMVYNLVKGIRTGNFKILYDNGQPQIVGQLVNNQNEGLWRYFYPNYKIESQGSFVNNIAEGNWKWYYEDGKVSEQGNFIHGLREGKWQQYDEMGKVSMIKYFIHGVEKSKKEFEKQE